MIGKSWIKFYRFFLARSTIELPSDETLLGKAVVVVGVIVVVAVVAVVVVVDLIFGLVHFPIKGLYAQEQHKMASGGSYIWICTL